MQIIINVKFSLVKEKLKNFWEWFGMTLLSFFLQISAFEARITMMITNLQENISQEEEEEYHPNRLYYRAMYVR